MLYPRRLEFLDVALGRVIPGRAAVATGGGLHEISPSVRLNAIRGKPADTERGRIMRAAANVYSLSSGKDKGERHMGNCQCPAWPLLIGVLARVFATRVLIHALARASESNGRKRTQPRVDARDAVRCGRAFSLRPDGANEQGARRGLLRRAPFACGQDGG